MLTVYSGCLCVVRLCGTYAQRLRTCFSTLFNAAAARKPAECPDILFISYFCFVKSVEFFSFSVLTRTTRQHACMLQCFDWQLGEHRFLKVVRAAKHPTTAPQPSAWPELTPLRLHTDTGTGQPVRPYRRPKCNTQPNRSVPLRVPGVQRGDTGAWRARCRLSRRYQTRSIGPGDTAPARDLDRPPRCSIALPRRGPAAHRSPRSMLHPALFERRHFVRRARVNH